MHMEKILKNKKIILRLRRRIIKLKKLRAQKLKNQAYSCSRQSLSFGKQLQRQTIDLQKSQNIKLSNKTTFKLINLCDDEIDSINLPSVSKINFTHLQLPQCFQQKFQRRQKLLNTFLMLTNTKFIIVPPGQISLQGMYLRFCKWNNAIIIYQIQHKKTNHFGLLIKYKHRYISFDGLSQMCPSYGEKTYHWQAQQDNWSCGYRVLFWHKKIVDQGGIQEWIRNKQPQQYD